MVSWIKNQIFDSQIWRAKQLAFLNPQTHSPTLYLNRNPLHRAGSRPDKTDTVVDVQVTPTAPTEPEPLQGDNIEQALQRGDIEQVLNKIPLP